MSDTQVQKLVRFFVRNGGPITAAQARARYGVKNMRARICDLRDLGFNIATTMKKNRRSDAPVAYYSLSGSTEIFG